MKDSEEPLSGALVDWEDNDCAVWAFLYALNISYEESHELCREYFLRECKKGVVGFDFFMQKLIEVQFDFERRKLFKGVTRQKARSIYKEAEEYVERRNTINTFLKNNPVGTFILSVKDHVVTVVNGTLKEAPGVSEALGRRVLYAYELLK